METGWGVLEGEKDSGAVRGRGLRKKTAVPAGAKARDSGPSRANERDGGPSRG